MCKDTGLSLSIQPKVVKGSLTRGQAVSRRVVMPGCLIIYFGLNGPPPPPPPHTRWNTHTNVTLVEKSKRKKTLNKVEKDGKTEIRAPR